MGHGGASARPLGRSRSTGFLPRSSSLRSLRTNMMSAQVAPGGTAGQTWLQLFIVVLLVGLVVAGGAFLVLNWGGMEYAVVIDSGSTGTRCYVYSWSRHGTSGLPKVVDSSAKLGRAERFGQKRAAYKRVETEPGLDQFVGDVIKLNQALDPLLQYALKEVPQSKRADTPVLLFATAGLRRLPSEHSSWILQMAQQILTASPFLFKPGWARIISGQDEAVYGWIALNYLTGKLGQAAEMLGSLDLGGSSLEVTFLPEDPPGAKHGTNVTIRGTDHQLYAHSHSSFGLNDAFEKSVLLAMEDSAEGEESLEVAHPCLQAGYNATYQFKHRSPDATVSTSALADKALETGRGRRLLQWASSKLLVRNVRVAGNPVRTLESAEDPVRDSEFVVDPSIGLESSEGSVRNLKSAEDVRLSQTLPSSILHSEREHSEDKPGQTVFSRLATCVKRLLGSSTNSKEQTPVASSLGLEVGFAAEPTSLTELLRSYLRPWYKHADQVIRQLTGRLTRQNAQSAASHARLRSGRSRSRGSGAVSTDVVKGLENQGSIRYASKRTERVAPPGGFPNPPVFLSATGRTLCANGKLSQHPTAKSTVVDSFEAERVFSAMHDTVVKPERGSDFRKGGRLQMGPVEHSGEIAGQQRTGKHAVQAGLFQYPGKDSGHQRLDFRASGKGRILAERSVPASVQLVGRPDWGNCQDLVDRVVTSAGECDEAPCALGAHQPALKGQFMALTGFFVVYHFFGLPGRAPLGRLLEAGHAFCEKSWADVEAEFYGERGFDRYCFRAPYVVSLLQKGLGFRTEQVQVGTGDMAWTLGAALYEGGALKVAAKPLALERPGGQSMSQLLQVHRSQLPATFSRLFTDNLPLVIVILALVGLTAVTVVRWSKMRARSFDARARRAYLPLYSVGNQGVASDVGKPGHALSRRLIDRQRASLLETIPASPPVKAPSQSGLASRRTASVDAGTELQRLEVQRSFVGELNQVEEEYSP